jgi:hypothetical protein
MLMYFRNIKKTRTFENWITDRYMKLKNSIKTAFFLITVSLCLSACSTKSVLVAPSRSLRFVGENVILQTDTVGMIKPTGLGFESAGTKHLANDPVALQFNQERVDNHNSVFDFLAMLHVFRIQGCAIGQKGRTDNQAIVKRKAIPLCYSQAQ